MKLKVSDHFDAKDWDETVSRLGGSLFHSSVWAKYSTAVRPNLSELYLTYLDDEDVVVGVALAFVEKSSHRLASFLSKQMTLHATPAVKDDDTVLHQFLVELEKYCRKNGFTRLSIFSYASPDISEQLARCDYDLTRRYEFLIDLDQTEEELRRGLSRTTRRSIAHAEKSGVTVHELPVEESIASLEVLGEESADRILRRKGIDLHHPDIGVVKRADIFSEAGVGRFFSAVIDGEVVSTSLFTLYNGMVNHNLAGSNDKAVRAEASKLVIWQAILSYKAAGASIFNLGGVKADATEPDSLEHGVYWFKKRFGTRIVECASGEKILGAKRTKLFNLLKSVT